MESTLSVDGLSTFRCHCWSMGTSKGLVKTRVSRREFDNVCVVACLGQCVMRESCASVENLVGACTCTYRWRGCA